MAEEATAGPPAVVEVQDPLPENDWFWRRLYVFICTTAFCTAVYWFATHIAASQTATQTGAFLSLAKWTLLLIWFMVTYYLIAPSAEHVTRMWQTAQVLKSGVSMFTSKTAVSPDGGTASAQSGAGMGVDSQDQISSADEPDIGNGSPVHPQKYEGPALEDRPPVDPSLPEDAPWQR